MTAALSAAWSPRRASVDRRPRDEGGRVYLRQSGILAFQDCPRRYFWSALEGIEPVRLPARDPRTWGSAVHKGLELAWSGRPELAPEAVADFYPDRHSDHAAWEQWQRGRAALEGYGRRWHDGAEHAPGILLALEGRFTGPLPLPPDRESERFALQGTVDGTKFFPPIDIRPRWGDAALSPGIYLIEHKTRRGIDAGYIEKIWADFQTLLYGDQVERAFGEPVVGTLYDVIGKTGLEHREGETREQFAKRVQGMLDAAERGELGRRLRLRKGEHPAEFHARRIEAGRREAQAAVPIEPEDPDAFQSRLADWYDRPDSFLRVATTTDPARRLSILQNTAQVADQIAYCEDTGHWTRSEGACHRPGRVCDFWPICSSGDDPRVIETQFKARTSDHGKVHPSDTAKTDSDRFLPD